MNDATKNGILIAAIVAGILSLPTTWITIRNAKMRITPNFGGQALTPSTDFSNFFVPNASNMSLDVTGLNGHVTLFAKFPIWFIVGLSITSCVFLLADNAASISFPGILLWCMALASLGLTILPLVIAVGSGRASPGIGWALGLACAVAPVGVLWSTRNRPPSEQSANSDD